MSEKVLENLVKQVMTQSGNHVSFGWQGGEPTLMGVDFFEKALALQKKYGSNQTVGNGLQTNGILIDDRWAQFLSNYKFLIGLSLDGTEHIHDYYRRNVAGKGSWEKVVEGGKRLLDHGCEVNALSVVNDYSVLFPDEIVEFFRELGLNYMQFIPCFEPDTSDSSTPASFSVEAEQYGQFLCRIFDLWLASFVDGLPTTSVRFFDSVFYCYVDKIPPECTLLSECGNYVVVEHNGDVFSCDFFVEPEWQLGNITENLLVEMLNSRRQDQFGKIKNQFPEKCKSCQWLQFCRGGCTKYRRVNSEGTELNYFCRSFEIFFEHADSRLKMLAQSWKEKHRPDSVSDQVAAAVSSGEIHAGRNDPCPCGSGIKFKKCCGQHI